MYRTIAYNQDITEVTICLLLWRHLNHYKTKRNVLSTHTNCQSNKEWWSFIVITLLECSIKYEI